jgi:hypothetical protein
MIKGQEFEEHMFKTFQDYNYFTCVAYELSSIFHIVHTGGEHKAHVVEANSKKVTLKILEYFN